MRTFKFLFILFATLFLNNSSFATNLETTDPPLGTVGIASVVQSHAILDHHNSSNRRYRHSSSGLEFFTSEVFNYNFSFKFGGRHFYQILNISSNKIWPWRYKKTTPQWAFGLGFGVKGRVLGIPLRTELSFNHINENKFFDVEKLNAYGQLRLLFDIPIFSAGISIGPTYSVHVSNLKDQDTGLLSPSAFLPGNEQNESTSDLSIFHWLGFSLGVVF